MSTKSYICAIENGSCSTDRSVRDTNNATRGDIEVCVCGQIHRSYRAAASCRQQLADANDAAWYSAHIHDGRGHRIEPSRDDDRECYDANIPTA